MPGVSSPLTVLASSPSQLVGQVRAYAAASEAINWDSIGGIVQSDAGKRELASLRNTMLELERAVGSAASSSTSPDWAPWVTAGRSAASAPGAPRQATHGHD